MAIVAANSAGVTGGVDTHLDVRVAAALDDVGGAAGCRAVCDHGAARRMRRSDDVGRATFSAIVKVSSRLVVGAFAGMRVAIGVAFAVAPDRLDRRTARTATPS
jgi:hypothetical protein